MNKTKTILRSLIVLLALTIAALFITWHFSTRRPPAPRGLSEQDLGSVGEFRLINQDGKTVTRNDLKGKVWVADFVFTRCMGPCPLLTRRMAALQKEFAKEDDLRFVSFSVDPDYDKPEILKSYAEGFGANLDQWHFLTGPREEIYSLIRENFKLAVAPTGENESGGMDILHSLHFVLVDSDARIKGYFNTAEDGAVDRLKEELRKTLDPELARE